MWWKDHPDVYKTGARSFVLVTSISPFVLWHINNGKLHRFHRKHTPNIPPLHIYHAKSHDNILDFFTQKHTASAQAYHTITQEIINTPHFFLNRAQSQTIRGLNALADPPSSQQINVATVNAIIKAYTHPPQEIPLWYEGPGLYQINKVDDISIAMGFQLPHPRLCIAYSREENNVTVILPPTSLSTRQGPPLRLSQNRTGITDATKVSTEPYSIVSLLIPHDADPSSNETYDFEDFYDACSDIIDTNIAPEYTFLLKRAQQTKIINKSVYIKDITHAWDERRDNYATLYKGDDKELIINTEFQATWVNTVKDKLPWTFTLNLTAINASYTFHYEPHTSYFYIAAQWPCQGMPAVTIIYKDTLFFVKYIFWTQTSRQGFKQGTQWNGYMPRAMLLIQWLAINIGIQTIELEDAWDHKIDGNILSSFDYQRAFKTFPKEYKKRLTEQQHEKLKKDYAEAINLGTVQHVIDAGYYGRFAFKPLQESEDYVVVNPIDMKNTKSNFYASPPHQ